jgi:hypothetical protein
MRLSRTTVQSVCATVVLFLSGIPIGAQQPPSAPASIDSLAFLVGKWVGEGTNEGRAGSGYASFETTLNGKALLRRNHAEYPGTEGRPGGVHDDLMIVYADTASKQLRAFYTDTEGNTIHYAVTLSADGETLVFRSDAETGARYRLTYTRVQPDRMGVTFERAPADKPDQFVKFIDGTVRRSSER